MGRNLGTVVAVVVGLLVIASLSLFIVDQRQNAIVFRLGEVVRVERMPGLYAKVPLLDNVRFFDTRILTIDSAEPETAQGPSSPRMLLARETSAIAKPSRNPANP